MLHAAECTLQQHLPLCTGKCGRIGVEHQFACGGKVAVQAGLRHHGVEPGAAARRQCQQSLGCAARHIVAAGSQKLQAPGPLRRVRLDAQLEWRIARQQQLGELTPDGSVGQRLHIGIAQLCAIGAAGAGATGGAVHYRDVVALLHQFPGAGQAHDACAQDCNRAGRWSLNHGPMLGRGRLHVECQSAHGPCPQLMGAMSFRYGKAINRHRCTVINALNLPA